jgi:hypothetical protein
MTISKMTPGVYAEPDQEVYPSKAKTRKVRQMGNPAFHSKNRGKKLQGGKSQDHHRSLEG